MKHIKKYILGALGLIILTVVSIVFYYRIDPNLLTQLSFYMELANPAIRIVRVQPGLRKEEVAQVLQEKLDWGVKEKMDFIGMANIEGHYFPKTYLINKDETPSNVATTMQDEFNTQVSKIAKPKASKIMNDDTVLKIASIIQREAAGKQDMNLISGIIWNRVFKEMKLQMDATIQYAKGNAIDGWWEPVASTDTKIKSSYNTYLYPGLPPGAISNPGIDAIAAAYNPQKTNCLFYLHDSSRQIHCSATFEGHRENIAMYLK